MKRIAMALAAAWFAAAPLPADDWTMWGGDPSRNMVNTVEKNVVSDWSYDRKTKTGKNVKWVQELGSQSYGNPVVAQGKVLVGTNNEGGRQPAVTGDKGVIVCFDAESGEFLWQATHDKHPAGRIHDWPQQGICSSPAVDGDRIYYVNNRCELVCADLNGFRDGENDGPYKDEALSSEIDADFIWIVDMMKEYDVFPHNLATSSPMVIGDYVFLVSGNGVDEGHIVLPTPFAPSFLCIDKNTGELVWEDASPSENILHGQWSAPAYAVIDGVEQAIFPGGDGVIYSFEAKTGDPLWSFDCNPRDSEWILGGMGTRNNVIATPVIHDNSVFIAVGQDPEHGEGQGHLFRIDATLRGDITETGAIWENQDIKRSMTTVAIHDGVLYACDLSGYFRALDVETGETLWTHDLLAAVWASPMVADGKVFIGDEDGDVVIFQEGREKKVLNEVNMGNAVYTTPTPANGILYIANRTHLFALQEGAGTQE